MPPAAPTISAKPTTRRGVSVIIPCYKQAQYLPQTIESVLAQEYTPIEILVINDGSPDDTAKVAARYGDRIKYIEQVNQGLSAARNTGLRHATGEFLHFLDSDDYVRPGFYEKLTAVLATRPEAAAAYCGYQWVDVNSVFLGERLPVPEVDDWFHRLLEENPWPPNALLFRAAALEAAGNFDVKLRSCEDWDVWLRLAATGARFAPAPGFIGVCYRRHPFAMSNNPWVMLETGLRVITRNARRHKNCAQCRISVERGREHMRKICFEEKLIPKLQPMLDQQAGRYLRECGRALFYDPASAWRGLGLLRHQKRRLLSGLAHLR